MRLDNIIIDGIESIKDVADFLFLILPALRNVGIPSLNSANLLLR